MVPSNNLFYCDSSPSYQLWSPPTSSLSKICAFELSPLAFFESSVTLLSSRLCPYCVRMPFVLVNVSSWQTSTLHSRIAFLKGFLCLHCVALPLIAKKMPEKWLEPFLEDNGQRTLELDSITFSSELLAKDKCMIWLPKTNVGRKKWA